MKGNRNFPNKQVTSSNMTGNTLYFRCNSRSSSRENRDTSRLRSPNRTSSSSFKPYYGYSNLKQPSRLDYPYPRLQNFQNNKTNYNNNNYPSNSRTQSPNYNRDENHPRQPFSRFYLKNLPNCINSLLAREQTDDKTSNNQQTETQNVSKEQVLEQQFNDLLLEHNQDSQNECLWCQEEC